MRPDVTAGGRGAEPRRQPPARGIGARRDGGRSGIRVLGALPRRGAIELPERHLGLVQAEETPELDRIIADAAEFVAAHVDLDAVRAAAGVTRLRRDQARSWWCRPASGSLWPAMPRFPLSTRIFWIAGARRGRDSAFLAARGRGAG